MLKIKETAELVGHLLRLEQLKVPTQENQTGMSHIRFRYRNNRLLIVLLLITTKVVKEEQATLESTMQSTMDSKVKLLILIMKQIQIGNYDS